MCTVLGPALDGSTTHGCFMACHIYLNLVNFVCLLLVCLSDLTLLACALPSDSPATPLALLPMVFIVGLVGSSCVPSLAF